MLNISKTVLVREEVGFILSRTHDSTDEALKNVNAVLSPKAAHNYLSRLNSSKNAWMGGLLPSFEASLEARIFDSWRFLWRRAEGIFSFV